MGRRSKTTLAKGKRATSPTGATVADTYSADHRAALFLGDCFDLLRAIPADMVDLTVTSPPYCIGKRHEKTRSVDDFIDMHRRLAPEIARVTRPGGSICWQVGYHVVWSTKSGAEYDFHLDPVRVPQKYPGKRHHKGKNKGEYSGNPLGKNPEDVWSIPNVKANHVEKTKHPCQFPVGLVQRLIRG